MATSLKTAVPFVLLSLLLIAFYHLQIKTPTTEDLYNTLNYTQGAQTKTHLVYEDGTTSFAKENEKRLVHIAEVCEDRGKAFKVQRLTKVFIYPYLSICVSPKAGSTSWKALRKKYSQSSRSAPSDIPLKTVISVRNPFTRLTSAYRDKFLNGNPISIYDKEWIESTQSKTRWLTRWYTYWLPALVSRGDIEPSPYIAQRRIITRRPDHPCERLFSPTARAQVLRDYKSGNDYQERFRNATFSFTDFLRHILWTWDMGIVNKHWSPQSCHCTPCALKYDYVLHMESVSLEAREVFAEVGLEGAENSKKHSTKAALDVTDKGYFESVDRETMAKIMELYKHDFEFFGYSKSF